MATRDNLWREFVDNYEIDVPESAIENEFEYIKLDMKHRMQYDSIQYLRQYILASRSIASLGIP